MNDLPFSHALCDRIAKASDEWFTRNWERLSGGSALYIYPGPRAIEMLDRAKRLGLIDGYTTTGA